VSVVSAVDVHGSVEFNKVCLDIKALKPTRVTLDWGTYSAHVWRDGRFVLRNVEPGSYVLNVLARDHVFDQVSGVSVRYHCLELDRTPHYPTPSLPQLPYPIVLKPRIAKVYVEPKKDFNPIDMFRSNPIMLVMLGSVAMMFLMPKIISNMDPQDREEFLATQSKMMAMPTQLSQG
ncbi:hypothetical protein M407DRAFT_41219, partial [Tulasnella calospora MUT 4182]